MNVQLLGHVVPQSPENIHRCRLCSSPLEHTFVNLGMSPLCESFITKGELDGAERYFPLHVLICEHCFLVQLREYVNPEQIFSEYAYFSSYSTSWVAHAKSFCDMITRRLRLHENSLVVELASNDGYLLQHFLPLGIPVLGIEPAANVAEVAIAKGIETRVDFFGLATAARFAAQGKKADLIIGNNVLAQVPDLNDFVAGMVQLLKPEGVITLEFPHLQRLMEGNQFDTIYHEHFSYFSLVTVEAMAALHGLALFDVEELPTHGGSLRIYLSHKSANHQRSDAVDRLLAREEQLGFRTLDAYAPFAKQVQKTKRELLSFLISAKNADKKICGYGAPGKGNTLLNYCGIGTDFLDFTVDRNSYKHGRFTPGMHIPIHPVEALDAAKPDYILLLPWNLRHEIIPDMWHVADWGAKFIVPIPKLKVINPRELHP